MTRDNPPTVSMHAPALVFNETHAIKCELAVDVLRSSGSLRLQVMGWSMLPTIWPGDTLMLQRANFDEVREGDIVLVSKDRRLIVHRLVSKRVNGLNRRLLCTRGDAMRTQDAQIGEGDLLGKVAFILRKGRCIEPRRALKVPERAVATLARNSETASRFMVGIYGLYRTSQAQQ